MRDGRRPTRAHLRVLRAYERFVARHSAPCCAEVADELGLTFQMVARHASALERMGLMQRVGGGPRQRPAQIRILTASKVAASLGAPRPRPRGRPQRATR
jgi:DNA-binding MarR family transcriptional regulator